MVVGTIGKPHGLHGESTVLPTSDTPDRFAAGAVFLTDDGRELVVTSSQPYRDQGLLVRFDGVTSRRAAEALRGHALTIDLEERRDLAAGEFWDDDLIGLRAVDPSGVPLGVVSAIDSGPGQDRLVIETEAGALVLVPFVGEIVGDPRPDGTIVIDAPQGLFESGER